ncbi:hypothetical protein K437DRAFT_295840 [Tilletiaria anomala UBC 951]|uniref:PX domain-containing protein n=1 Tax=Tilletiaria anomala (strain ATCC 24038 / CBS 436.72 / UBC 951) TaxID=1037660 RepID=A0A066VFC7_TILAU|nr:uncharacterized protein K437DRAFT_295840 [Tilletiaria anomala UBC 951]KDN40422.1 hypothetical protein K437DRAFT_295840 [Tilletiaria anomala UBC 951]
MADENSERIIPIQISDPDAEGAGTGPAAPPETAAQAKVSDADAGAEVNHADGAKSEQAACTAKRNDVEEEDGWGDASIKAHSASLLTPNSVQPDDHSSTLSSEAPSAYNYVDDGQGHSPAANTSRQSSSGSTGARQQQHEPVHVEIVDAQKSTDGHTTSTFITYVIRSGSLEAKRRYSEFEAFREALVKLFPVSIVPPIPDKHSLGDYAVKQSKAKEDAIIIARRRRMLQSFLRRVAKHPTLGQSQVFLKFIDGRHQWHEIAASPPISMLPKSNLKAPPANPADPDAPYAYQVLPIPSSSAQLREPNQRFLDSEAFTDRFASHLTGNMEKVNRRTMKRWTEAGADYAELGAVLNGFSLSEHGELAYAIEKTGQAADASYVATGHMLQDWEIAFTEPLHEYAQFAGVLQKLLKWRHMKHLQFEYAQEALEAKRAQLEDLEKVENEASRLTGALERGGRAGLDAAVAASSQGASAAGGARDSVNAGVWGRSSLYGAAAEEPDAWVGAGGAGSASEPASAAVSPLKTSSIDHPRASTSSSLPLAAATRSSSALRSSKRFSSGYGLFGALSHTFQSVMDVDPEATRRNSIAKLRDSIAQLEEALALTEKDLQYATVTIQADLDRFQRHKVADMKEMAIEFVKIHREYCRVSLEQWKEAKVAVDRVDVPREMPESSLARHQRTEGSAPRGSLSARGMML